MSFGGDEFVQIARLALTGRPQDVQAYLRRLVRKARPEERTLAEMLGNLLTLAPSPASPLREMGGAMIPVDGDTRLSLLRQEFPCGMAEAPILSAALRSRLDQVLAERRNLSILAHKGLEPTRSLLFVGPPGVGKTMTARWVAESLGLPLLVLDLSAVISSYLGKTGTNLRNVLDYAKSLSCVLLLDEFDAVAKRRDDEAEIGELKRLVTVLLQEIDDWPETSLLIAATNHENLLDPAAWRRFDDIIKFGLPALELRRVFLENAFGDDSGQAKTWIPVLADVWSGRSFSDAEKSVQRIRRRHALGQCTLAAAITDEIVKDGKDWDVEKKRAVARALHKDGMSDHKIHDLTGISRDTLRKMWASDKADQGENHDGTEVSDRRRRTTGCRGASA